MLLSSGKDPYWEGWVSSDPENVCRLCSMMSTVLIFMDGLLPQVEKFKHLSVLEVELFSRPHLRPEGAGSDQKNKLLDASSESEILSEGVWSQPWDNGHLVSCLRFAR